MLHLATLLAFMMPMTPPSNPNQCVNEGLIYVPDVDHGLHWSKVHRFDIVIDEILTDSWLPSIKLAADRWNKAVGFEIFRVMVIPSYSAETIMETLQSGHYFPGLIPILPMPPQGQAANPGIIGVTLLDFTGNGTITQAPILLADRPDMYIGVKGVNVVTHELGHALGLSHDPACPKSVMFPYHDETESELLGIVKSDIELVKRLYKN